MTILGVDGAPLVAGIPRFEELPEYAFAISRISFGLHPDTGAPEYIRRARAARKITHGYPYLRTWEPPEKQAVYAVELARSFALPMIWVDCEPVVDKEGRYIDETDQPHIARGKLLAWIARARETSFPFGIYGGSWYLGQLNLPSWVGAIPLWLSHYGVKRPTVPAPWTEYAIWQREGDVEKAGAKIDINESPLTIEQFAALGMPLPYDTLAPVVSAVRAAEGRGATVESYTNTEEGPGLG